MNLSTFPALGYAIARVLAVAGCCAWAVTGFAAERLTIEPAEQTSAVFQESKPTFHFVVSSSERFAGSAGWSLSIGGRVFARGENAIQADAANPAKVNVSLGMPPGREGVVIPAELNISVYQNAAQPRAKYKRPIWIFPQNPFARRSRWLKQLDVTLFDPQGDTTTRFEQAEIPFQTVQTAAALGAIEKGMAVVGEGISLDEHRDLAETVVQLAKSGRSVLCLAPREGSFPLALIEGADGAAFHAKGISLRQRSVIRDLDKRLDAFDWSDHGDPVIAGISLKPDRAEILASISAEKDAWPWLEIDYEQSRLLVVGFGIIKSWEQNPTPRFLLASLLERLSGTNTEPGSGQTQQE